MVGQGKRAHNERWMRGDGETMSTRAAMCTCGMNPDVVYGTRARKLMQMLKPDTREFGRLDDFEWLVDNSCRLIPMQTVYGTTKD